MPAEKVPHQNSSFLSLQSRMISQKKNEVAQQIPSASLHKIKELKNEIHDLQHKLEESSLENHILKQLQCRHSKAIGRYQNSGSNLSVLLASHYQEVRTLRNLLRRSQENERNSSWKLRKVEAELLKAKDALRTLHMLSEDKALAEREELDCRLSGLTEKIKVNEKRIQSLEKQLKLNNSTFSHQLANEKKKAVEAGIITKNLQMEINSLHQKIKEKDRQLYVKYIYANRIPNIPKDKSDSALQEKSLSINRSVQVDKQSFRSLLLPQYQTQENRKKSNSANQGEKSSEVNQNATASEAQCRTEKPSTKKIPKPETFNRTHREYLGEDGLLMKEHTSLESMKKRSKKKIEEKERDLLKWELKNQVKTEQTSPSDSVKENNQEEDAGEEHEKEEKKADEQLNNSEKTGSKCADPSPRKKIPIRLKKKYIVSEASENLHQGLLPSGTKPKKKGSLCNHRHAGQDCSETAESEVKNSFGLYEPPFGKATKTRQEYSSTGAEGCAHMTLAERKKSLRKSSLDQAVFEETTIQVLT